MLKKILKILFKILKVLSVAFIIAALIVVLIQKVTNNKLRLFGYGVYTVISESMLPEYEVGDMFLAKVVDEKDIKEGDDLVYIGEVDSYKDKIVTHRVIRIEADKSIVTKGINNDLEDPPIKYKQVYGRVHLRLLILSLFSKLMNNNILFYVIIFVPFTFLIFLDTKELFGEKKKEPVKDSKEPKENKEEEEKIEENKE
jgi:signal peptidase